MYTAFYGLREKPFALSPNPRFLYLAESHREALAHLLYGLEQNEGFIVISGEVGTGKTTICRSLLSRLGAETEVAFLFNPSVSALELLQSINEEFGLPAAGLGRRELLAHLNRFLLERNHEHKRVVLIIDEAQNLSPETLEQVRLLSNLETESSKLIQIILLGQPELAAKLDSDDLRQLRQRIGVRWDLAPLPPDDAIAYVQHRLRVAAGAERDIFDRAALREIHRRTGGVPRLINVLCDRALLAGYASRAHRIGARLVIDAAEEVPGLAKQARPSLVRRLRIPLALATLLLGLTTVGLWTGRIDLPLQAGSGAPATSTPLATASLPAVSSPGADDALLEMGIAEAGEVITIAENEPAPSRLALSASGASGAAPEAASPDDLARDDEGAFLAEVLTSRSEGEGTRLAVASLLSLFGVSAAIEAPLELTAARGVLEAADLAVHTVSDADFPLLRRTGYPALLPLEAADGETRWVALVAADDEMAELAGVGMTGRLRVPREAVEGLWTGTALVVWRPEGEIPTVLGLGQRGGGVYWLQHALSELGHFARPINGRYDSATEAAVRAFQRSEALTPDGVAGPLTQMALYRRLGTYRLPTFDSAPTPEAGAPGGATLVQDGASG